MEYLVTGKEMRQIDKNTTSAFKVPEVVLMEQAALAFCDELLISHNPKRVLVFCGCGNNGADGIAVARLLNLRGVFATVFLCSEAFDIKKTESDLLVLQKDIYNSYGFSVINDLEHLNEYDVIVDAIFGVGINRSVDEPFYSVIQTINETESFVISLDIASGINADNGEILNIAVKADETYTFAYKKVGQLLWPGFDYTGRLYVLEIGINNLSWGEKKPRFLSVEKEDLALIAKRYAHSNKGSYGKTLIIAGLDNAAGAAILACKACYATGTGLVKVFSAGYNRDIILNAVPEVIFQQLDVFDSFEEKLLNALEWADSIVIGPGNGCGDFAKKVLEIVLEKSRVPVVIDADALNVLAVEDNLWKNKKCECIITPHLKEMSRLINAPIEYIQKDLIGIASDFSNTHECVCVLKDFHTIVALPYGQVYINQTGNNGMATAGSGDALSGIIGSLLSSGETTTKAAPYGVFIHGLAGDIISCYTGYHGMMATDIICGIKMMWSQVDIDVEK